MKKIIYIGLFTIFGILFQFLAHGMVEILYINALTKNFSRWSLGLTWDQWFAVHAVGTVILFSLGAALGLWGGFFFWQKIYVEGKCGKRTFRR